MPARPWRPSLAQQILIGLAVGCLVGRPASAFSSSLSPADGAVTLEPIDSAQVASLVRNDTQNLRLINVWATWCVPCIEEFPNVVNLIRRFQNRNFEVITISIDSADHRTQALHFLQRQHAALPNRLRRVIAEEGRSTDNYLFTGRVDELQKVLDPEWPGPVPYTLLVAPGGKVLYRRVGAFDPADVRARIVGRLGPCYNPATKP